MSNTWRVPPHLFCLIVAPPGSKKTPALERISEPVRQIDKKLFNEYEATQAELLPDGPEPVLQQLVLDDVTREAVALIHAENPRGLIILKDEALGWIKSLNAYRGGLGADVQFWLSVNSGGSVKVNRKGNRESQRIDRTCIAMIGGLTPANLGLIRVSEQDDGWVDRLIICYPDMLSGNGEWQVADVPQDLLDEWQDAVQALWERQPQIISGQQYPHLIHLDEQALHVWRQWYRRHWEEVQSPDFSSELRGPWAKLEAYTLRYALILSQLHQVYRHDQGDPSNVDGLIMHHAGLLSQYSKDHFVRAMHRVRLRPIPDVARLAIPRLVQNQVREFRVSWLTRNYARYFSDSDELENTLSWLERHGFIRPKGHPIVPTATRRGRHSGTEYEVNPRLFAENADFADKISKMR
jgi:hypothetical protein